MATPGSSPRTVIPRWRRFRWRVAFLVVTVGLGLTGFMSGVGVSERAHVADADFPTQLYYTLGLFLFGGMDLGTPVGGPLWGRTLLWGAYFAAPLITASAVIETMLRLVGKDGLLLRRRKDHIIVAGTSRIATLYLERLREHDPQVSVVVVAASEEGSWDELRDEYDVQVLVADITSVATLRRLRVEHARAVFLLTDDDFANLDAADGILAVAPDVATRTVVHIADLRFMRSLAATQLARICRLFNGHQIAASHLVRTHMIRHFEDTEHTDTVVLAGFGRFGQTVLDELQRTAAGAFDRVVIVDLQASIGCGVFAEQLGFTDGYERHVIDGDIRDPSVWKQVEDHLDRSGLRPVVVVGSGNDRSNLRIALRLSGTLNGAMIVARSDRYRAFVKALSSELGILTVSVAQLVTQSMPAGWFTPAGRGAIERPDFDRGA